MRVVLLAKPFLSVTKQLAPHGGWVLKRLKELPVKGYTLLALNEVLSFSSTNTCGFAVQILDRSTWLEFLG